MCSKIELQPIENHWNAGRTAPVAGFIQGGICSVFFFLFKSLEDNGRLCHLAVNWRLVFAKSRLSTSVGLKRKGEKIQVNTECWIMNTNETQQNRTRWAQLAIRKVIWAAHLGSNLHGCKEGCLLFYLIDRDRHVLLVGVYCAKCVHLSELYS